MAPTKLSLKNPLQPGEVSNNKYMYICSSKKWSHCETVALWNSLGTCKTISIPMPCHWKPNCQRRSSLSLVAISSVDTARLPCAFAPVFMVRSYFQCCWQSIKKICVITETECIDNIDFVTNSTCKKTGAWPGAWQQGGWNPPANSCKKIRKIPQECPKFYRTASLKDGDHADTNGKAK